MSVAGGHPLPPTSSLPSLRSLDILTEAQVFSALSSLYTLYCPLPRAVDFQPHPKSNAFLSGTSTPLADSGYASAIDDEEDDDVCAETQKDALSALRTDVFERNFATRWLTSFIARAEELSFTSEETRQHAVDKAACIIASFHGTPDDEAATDEFDITRHFSFAVLSPQCPSSPANQKTRTSVDVRLNDAPLSGTDHTDVGLQSWGASIVFSDIVCSEPARFGLTREGLGGASPRIIELGAGTGLVSLAIAKLLPCLDVMDATVIATDYHAAVLENLHANIASNFPAHDDPLPVEACALDWASPSLDPPLHEKANVLVATDVIYAPEHAIWLRDCAARLLAPDGVFWLVATVRPTGKFEGISDTVRAAFTVDGRPKVDDGRMLSILGEEWLQKRKGVGRGDESGYRMFRIGWAI